MCKLKYIIDKRIILFSFVPVKALYSMMVMAALLVGCGGGGEGSGHAGTYAMTMKMLGEEIQVRFELKSDNTFTAVTYENGEKKDEDSKGGTWKVEGDDIVLMGKDEDGKEEGVKFNKDTLKLSAMTNDGKDGLDMLKALMGEEALTLKKL